MTEAVLATELKQVELRELWRRYKKQEDAQARERLVVAYAPLVKYVAGQVGATLPSHVEQGDLVSYGLVGLIGAIERYDVGRGVKFETFAAVRIRGAIIDGLRALDWVPRSVRAKARRLERAHIALEGRLHRAPSEEELAEQLDIDIGELRDTLTEIASSALLALDDPWTFPEPDGGQTTLLDALADPDAEDPVREADAEERRAELVAALASLDGRERLVIGLYYYEGLTLREIGEVLGVTESRASQIHTKGLIALRSVLAPTE
ncbi:MAG: FliA/WhiG family RNA polymerase sigma factor [Solirubrobacterales bacterium]